MVRSVFMSRGFVSERFGLLFEPESSEDIYDVWNRRDARVVDIAPFFQTPSTDFPIVYRRRLLDDGAKGTVISEFEDQVVPSPSVDPESVDVSRHSLLDIDQFWGLIASLNGSASRRNVAGLVRVLADLDPEGIEAFAAQLATLLSTIRTEEIADRAARNTPLFDSDAFLWWRLAVVAAGRHTFDQVASGTEELILSEKDWAAGENLIGVAEKAYCRRTRREVLFELPIDDDNRANSPHDEKLVLDSEEHSSPTLGRRDFAGSVVGSRFLMRDQDGVSECIVIQLVDRSAEDTCAVVSRLARAAAARIGGELFSTVKFYETYHSAIYSSLPVFEFKQRHAGTLERYLHERGFGATAS